MNIPRFQQIVLVVATIILLICLILIGIALYKHRYNEKYPPVIGRCPDYWIDASDTDSNTIICKRNNNKNYNQNLNRGTGHDEFTYDSSLLHGNHGICERAEKARKVNLSWDGITNSTVDCNKHHHHSEY